MKNGQGFWEKQWLESCREEWIRDLTALLKIPSVSQPCRPQDRYPFGGECAKALDEALAIAERMGFETQCHEYYCGTALWPGENPELGEIGIFLHLDVVPPGEGWKYPPFEGIREKGYIVARGSRDNKGPAVAALYAARCLREAGIRLRHNVRFFFGCNEELGMKDIEYYLKKNPAPAFSLVPDSPFPVCYGEKGVVDLKMEGLRREQSQVIRYFKGGIAKNQVPDGAEAKLEVNGDWQPPAEDGITAVKRDDGFWIKAKGRASHSAYPEGSVNAVVKLAGYLNRTGILTKEEKEWTDFIQKYFDSFYGEKLGIAAEDKEGKRLTCVLSMMEISQERFSARVNIRYPAAMDGGQICRKLRETVEQNGFEAAELTDNPGYCLDRGNPAIDVLNEIVCRRLDMNEPPYTANGGTYARKLPSPAVGYGPNRTGPHPFGPGRGTGHLPDEAVSISDLEAAIMVYTEALEAIDNLLLKES